MNWCLEDEMQALLAEESYLDDVISQLSDLKYRRGYDELLKDITKLLDELKDKKEKIQKGIREVTDDLLKIAEVCSGEYSGDVDELASYTWEY